MTGVNDSDEAVRPGSPGIVRVDRPVRPHSERYCVLCEKLGHRTNECNATHGLNILEHLRRQDQPRFLDRFAMACEPSFGANWRVPRNVLSHLLEEPWATGGGSKDFSKA